MFSRINRLGYLRIVILLRRASGASGAPYLLPVSASDTTKQVFYTYLG